MKNVYLIITLIVLFMVSSCDAQNETNSKYRILRTNLRAQIEISKNGPVVELDVGDVVEFIPYKDNNYYKFLLVSKSSPFSSVSSQKSTSRIKRINEGDTFFIRKIIAERSLVLQSTGKQGIDLKNNKNYAVYKICKDNLNYYSFELGAPEIDGSLEKGRLVTITHIAAGYDGENVFNVMKYLNDPDQKIYYVKEDEFINGVKLDSDPDWQPWFEPKPGSIYYVVSGKTAKSIESGEEYNIKPGTKVEILNVGKWGDINSDVEIKISLIPRSIKPDTNSEVMTNRKYIIKVKDIQGCLIKK